MDRTQLVKHLEVAEGHVVEGEKRVARQANLIKEMQANGRDTVVAERLLRTFEKIQTQFASDRDYIRQELTDFDSRQRSINFALEPSSYFGSTLFDDTK